MDHQEWHCPLIITAIWDLVLSPYSSYFQSPYTFLPNQTSCQPLTLIANALFSQRFLSYKLGAEISNCSPRIFPLLSGYPASLHFPGSLAAMCDHANGSGWCLCSSMLSPILMENDQGDFGSHVLKVAEPLSPWAVLALTSTCLEYVYI